MKLWRNPKLVFHFRVDDSDHTILWGSYFTLSFLPYNLGLWSLPYFPLGLCESYLGVCRALQWALNGAWLFDLEGCWSLHLFRKWFGSEEWCWPTWLQDSLLREGWEFLGGREREGIPSHPLPDYDKNDQVLLFHLRLGSSAWGSGENWGRVEGEGISSLLEAQTQAAFSTWTLPLGGSSSHLPSCQQSQHLPSLESVWPTAWRTEVSFTEGLPGARG